MEGAFEQTQRPEGSLTRMPVVRLVSRQLVEEQQWLPVEEPLVIEINGRKRAVLMRLPGHEKELAVGFCLSEGIIKSVEDIQLVHHCGSVGPEDGASTALPSESRNVVRIYCRGEAVAAEDPAIQLVRTGCGRVSFAGSLSVDFPLTRVDSSEFRVSFGVLRGLVRSLSENQLTKRLAGGVHAAILAEARGEIVAFFEDLSRHNALDKLIGHAAINDISLRDKAVLVTGRVSYEMVAKAARVALPVLVSLSGTTSLAVDLAATCGVTLGSYVRANSLIVHTRPERIVY